LFIWGGDAAYVDKFEAIYMDGDNNDGVNTLEDM